MSEAAPKAPKPPLWKRVKSAAKNFVSHAIGYIPRGIALTGTIFAGSALLESATGGFGLGVAGWDNPYIISRGLMHLALGSTISGVIGATTAPCECDPKGSGEQVSANPLPGKSEQGIGNKIMREVEHHLPATAAEAVFTGSGLSAAANVAKHVGIGT